MWGPGFQPSPAKYKTASKGGGVSLEAADLPYGLSSGVAGGHFLNVKLVPQRRLLDPYMPALFDILPLQNLWLQEAVGIICVTKWFHSRDGWNYTPHVLPSLWRALTVLVVAIVDIWRYCGWVEFGVDIVLVRKTKWKDMGAPNRGEWEEVYPTHTVTRLLQLGQWHLPSSCFGSFSKSILWPSEVTVSSAERAFHGLCNRCSPRALGTYPWGFWRWLDWQLTPPEGEVGRGRALGTWPREEFTSFPSPSLTPSGSPLPCHSAWSQRTIDWNLYSSRRNKVFASVVGAGYCVPAVRKWLSNYAKVGLAVLMMWDFKTIKSKDIVLKLT